MSDRLVRQIVTGQPASDGAGVRLNRVLNPQRPLDPFLMLDEFNSDSADDYIAGFPAHPHRGFETVTYMIDGTMLHEDHLGNRGLLTSGGVQWMTAGRGIIHSEMPQQEAGRMRGFQLWINLPAAEKMKPASYQDLAPEQIPVVDVDGGRIKIVAGEFQHGDTRTPGPVSGVTTQPLYLDIALEADAELSVPLALGHTAFVYVFEGGAGIGEHRVARGQLAVLDDGDRVRLHGGSNGARMLLLAAKPLREPIVQYGPFVMTTAEDIVQALRDYRDGRLTA